MIAVGGAVGSSSFNRAQLEALARTLAETLGGLTHAEVTNLLSHHHLPPQSESMPKWLRLFNAFALSQNTLRSHAAILQCVEDATTPARFLGRNDEFESFREQVNRCLAFVGRAVGNDGRVVVIRQANTLTEAEQRARELRSDLAMRGVHRDVLRFCRAELVADDYFHAVLEATKSVAQKMRDRTGLTDDGSVLIDHVFGGDHPILVINAFQTKSERSEQAGFCNLLKGIFGMFRNPSAHEPRILWHMTKADAEDLLSLISLVHRRIDTASMPPRA